MPHTVTFTESDFSILSSHENFKRMTGCKGKMFERSEGVKNLTG